MAAGLAHRVVIPYAPRPLQRVLHEALDKHRFAVAVCHRRFGKTVLAVNQLIKCAVTCAKERPRYAYIAPTYTQGKDAAWSYLKHYSSVIPGVDVNESELRIDYPNGGRVRIYGADNPDSLRGIYLDGVVLDEYGLMKAELWGEVIRPLLSDRQGWAFFIGTPNGKNEFYEKAKFAQVEPGWLFKEFKASQTHILPDSELADAARTMTPDEYAQEYECSFEASVKGAVFAREMQACRESGRITRVPFDPKLAVDTAWDLGIDDSTAIWFSQASPGGEVRLIGYYENRGHGLHHYVGVLREQTDRFGFVYQYHWAPHDIQVKELGTGQSRLETARQMGLQMTPVAKLSLDDGINAVRMLLPRCYFNEPSCSKGIEALLQYRWKPATNNQTGRSLPVHDDASHGADAFRTLACAPSKVSQLLAQWGRQNRDDDPMDKLYGKGKYRQGAGRGRGGW